MFENYYFYTHFGNPNSILMSKPIRCTVKGDAIGRLYIIHHRLLAKTYWE